MNRYWWLVAAVLVLTGCTGGGTQEAAQAPASGSLPPAATGTAAMPAPAPETQTARPSAERTAGTVTPAPPRQQQETEAARPMPAAPRPGTICPVMNSPVTGSRWYVDHAGKRIWLCCAHCVDVVKANPERYAAHGQ